jgi:predicted Zn-dependent protease
MHKAKFQLGGVRGKLRTGASRNFRLIPALMFFCCASLLSPARSPAQTRDYAQAETLIRNHQWDEGLALVLPLVKREPGNAKALNLAGLALTGKGDIQQANAYFERALLADPAFVPALKNLAFNEYNQKQLDASEKHLLAAEKALPEDPVIHLYLGEIAYREHMYPRAVEHLTKIRDFLARNPEVAAHLAVSYLQTAQEQKGFEILDTLPLAQVQPQSQFELGVALEQQGLPDRAIPWLAAVRQQFPDSYDIGFDLSLAYIAAKDYQQAIHTAQDLIARNHETSELQNVLAEAYEGNNEIQKAVDALRLAIALDPADEDNFLDFASLCMDQRSYDAGMTVIEVGLKSHPNSDRLIFMRGVLHAMKDEYELAESDFRLSAEIAPQTNLGFIGLGVTYLETGHDAEAIKVLRQRLHDKPNDPSLLYLLGEGLLRTGVRPGDPTYAEAQTDLERSVKLNPNLCLPHVSLGTIFLDEDRAKDAVAQFEQARAIDPKERSAYSHLAVAYRKLGDAEKAKEVLNGLKSVIEQERRSTREKMKAAGTEAGAASSE